MKKVLFALCCFSSLFFASCNSEDDLIPNEKMGVTYEVSIATPLDVEKLVSASNDSVFNVPVTVKQITEGGIKTKSVVEEVIPTNAVLTYWRGSTMCDFSYFYGAWICDVYTLSVKVDYGYGQWVNGHKGSNTGYATSGTISSTITQNAVQNKIDDNSGSWTFSTAAYSPKSNFIGQTFPGVGEWFPFKYTELKLYYTWIDGNN